MFSWLNLSEPVASFAICENGSQWAVFVPALQPKIMRRLNARTAGTVAGPGREAVLQPPNPGTNTSQFQRYSIILEVLNGDQRISGSIRRGFRLTLVSRTGFGVTFRRPKREREDPASSYAGNSQVTTQQTSQDAACNCPEAGASRSRVFSAARSALSELLLGSPSIAVPFLEDSAMSRGALWSFIRIETGCPGTA
jgi:hypothetical protein